MVLLRGQCTCAHQLQLKRLKSPFQGGGWSEHQKSPQDGRGGEAISKSCLEAKKAGPGSKKILFVQKIVPVLYKCYFQNFWETLTTRTHSPNRGVKWGRPNSGLWGTNLPPFRRYFHFLKSKRRKLSRMEFYLCASCRTFREIMNTEYLSSEICFLLGLWNLSSHDFIIYMILEF